MWRLHQEAATFTVDTEYGKNFTSWNDVCARFPSRVTPPEHLKYGDTTNAHMINPNVNPPDPMSTGDRQNSSFTGNWTDTVDYNLDEWDAVYDAETWDLEAEETRIPTEAERTALQAVPREVVDTIKSDMSLWIPREDYSYEVESLHSICYETSLLEIWGYNDTIISNLTDEKIIEDINNAFESKVYGFPTDFTRYLGGITRDIEGRIVLAKATYQSWTTVRDIEAIDQGMGVMDVGAGEEVDKAGLAWENGLIEVVSRYKTDDLMPHVNAAFSFGKIMEATIYGDVVWVVSGWMLLVVYVVVMLGGTCSRFFPAVIGIFCVAMSVLVSYSLCSAASIPFGPLNSVLPMLLVGLGVDDMFVIIAAWDATASLGRKGAIRERAKAALKQAGVAITVTSGTDIVAFAVGSTTKFPALRWFCIYAAVGITAVYILQATVFVAAVVIDQKRRDRNEEVDQENCNCVPTKRNDLGIRIMGNWAQFLLKPGTTAIILLGTGFILGVSLWKMMDLRQEFNHRWLLPQSSALRQWYDKMDDLFPQDGEQGRVFFSNITLPDELPALRELSLRLRDLPSVRRVDAWYNVLDLYMYQNPHFRDRPLTKSSYYDALGLFLHTSSGAGYRSHFLFDVEPKCNTSDFSFSSFKIEFQFVKLLDRDDQQKAMKEVRRVVSEVNLKGYHDVWSQAFSQWETDATITEELWRNLALVLGVVAVMTLLLLGDPRAVFLVLFCVFATLIVVGAIMELWNLTIDTVSCIALVLAIGLCVDYAAHVAHGFLVAQGSRATRVVIAMSEVGPAVFHGACSTFLAFILLAPSDSHACVSFFKIFTSVSVFGLYHGLVVLPILLSLIGPQAYPVRDINKKHLMEVIVLPGDPLRRHSHPSNTRNKDTINKDSSIRHSASLDSSTPNSASLDNSGQSAPLNFTPTEVPIKSVEEMNAENALQFSDNEQEHYTEYILDMNNQEINQDVQSDFDNEDDNENIVRLYVKNSPNRTLNDSD